MSLHRIIVIANQKFENKTFPAFTRRTHTACNQISLFFFDLSIQSGYQIFNIDNKILLNIAVLKANRGRKEGNVLFNDTLNTFYLRLYGVRHMVKDHSDSEKGNPLSPHGLFFPISSKGSFIYIRPQTG